MQLICQSGHYLIVLCHGLANTLIQKISKIAAGLLQTARLLESGQTCAQFGGKGAIL